MNILLWVLQVLAALLYGASGTMKIFMFDKISAEVPSLGALPQIAKPPRFSLSLSELLTVCVRILLCSPALLRSQLVD